MKDKKPIKNQRICFSDRDIKKSKPKIELSKLPACFKIKTDIIGKIVNVTSNGILI